MSDDLLGTVKAALANATPGPWTACRMTHHEREDDLTPEEIGEYVRNSVVKSTQESGSGAFLFVSAEKLGGPADVCHVGNGPTSPQNAHLIANAPDWLRALVAEVERLQSEVAVMAAGTSHDCDIIADGAETEEQLRADLMGQLDAYDILLDRANALERENAALRHRHAEAVKLLADVEWAGTDSVYLTRFCVWCDENEKHGHADNCRYVALLAKARLT